MQKLRVIQGKTVEDKLLSVDGILEGILSKQILIQNVLNKKKKDPHAFYVSDYKDVCKAGEVVCGFIVLTEIKLERVVIVVEEYPETKELAVMVNIISEDGVARSTVTTIKQGVNKIVDTRSLNPGDKVSLIVRCALDECPKGIWSAVRGERI